MDKWKDIELEKMKAGGNGKFRIFLELQDDYDPTWNLQEKYNSKAAALFRDQVRCADLMVYDSFPTRFTSRTKFSMISFRELNHVSSLPVVIHLSIERFKPKN